MILQQKYKIVSLFFQRLLKLLLIIMAVCSLPFLTGAQTVMNQNATSSGAGLVSGGNYTGYVSAGQMATYMYANGSAIATQGIILNEISADVEFTFELSGNLTENQNVNANSLVLKSSFAELEGTPLANVLVYLIIVETNEVYASTETDENGYFEFLNVPFLDFYFTVGTPEIPEEPVVLAFEENPVFVKDVEINGEVGTGGLTTTSVVVTPQQTSGNDVQETKLRYFDKDKDGFGSGTTLVRLNINDSESGFSENNIDCDDNNMFINPDAQDLPGSGIDANCDGYFLWYVDSDLDGFGGAETISSVNETPGIGESYNNLDCDDLNSEINPDAYDPPDGSIDANCDGIFGCQEITSVLFDAPHEPVEINNNVNIFAIVIGTEIKSASWDWGDNSASSATISNNELTGSHTYTGPGVYVVTLTVKNYCGQFFSYYFKYMVIYDPSSGFVTGSGTIFSPKGASVMYPNETGIASFGFVSKYDKKKGIPKGNTEFEFNNGDLQFVSTEYEWLVVAGSKAKFKGRGSINGIPGYQFMISAIDGDIKEKGDPDYFRIKIWDEATGDIVYDNEMNIEIDADPTTIILDGSIKIHTPKIKSNLLATGIDANLFQEMEFQVYPNPTNGMVKVSGFTPTNEYILKLIDMNGREIEVKKNSSYETEIDLTNSPAGIYNLVIQQNAEIKSFQIIRK